MIDATTGRIQFVFDPDKIPMPYRVPMAFTIWIHNGQFWGLPGRLIALMTGLTLTVLFPTGFYIWYRQRKSRKAMASRKSTGRPLREAA
jgi:uncharacterized iron-regulated membrane protein